MHRGKFCVALYWDLTISHPSIYRYSITQCIAWPVLILALYTEMYLLLFSTNTSCKNNCNSNCRGQHSGWNLLIVVMCNFTRILPKKNSKLDTKSYCPIPTFIWGSILNLAALFLGITTFTRPIFRLKSTMMVVL